MLRSPGNARHSCLSISYAVGLALLLAGCSADGDFGRPRHIAAVEAALLPTGEPAHTAGIAARAFPLTDDERQLRALARNLLAPPYDAGWPPGAFVPERRDIPLRPVAHDAEVYIGRLIDGAYRSATARYARLIDDTRNDLARIEPFFAVARRTADLDRKREQSLAYVSTLPQDELTSMHRRLRENMLLVSEVHRTLQERAIMYRFALERLVIALPSPMAAEAERARSELERRLAAIQVFAPGHEPAGGDGPAAQL